MAIEREDCYAPLYVPTERPDAAPFVYVPLSKQWRDLFVDLCAYLECGCFWAEGEDTDEGYTGALIAAKQFIEAKEAHMVDVGAVVMWVTTVIPPGWLLCDGDLVNTADYPELFAVLGYDYGGSGAQFGLPNMVDRSPMGAGATVGIGGATGATTHTLTASENGVHTHLLNDPGHSHRERVGNGAGAYVLGGAGGSNPTVGNGLTTNTALMYTEVTGTGIAVQNSAGGTPHNNLHPVRGVHFIIWSGVT